MSMLQVDDINLGMLSEASADAVSNPVTISKTNAVIAKSQGVLRNSAIPQFDNP